MVMKNSNSSKLLFPTKRNAFLSVSALVIAFFLAELFPGDKKPIGKELTSCVEVANHTCIMKTIFGLDQDLNVSRYASSPEVDASVKKD